MSRRAIAPKPGLRRSMPLKLPADLALDLHAFCEVHFDAPQSHVICAALRQFISSELRENQIARSRFEVVRRRLETAEERKGRTTEPFKLVEAKKGPAEADKPTE